MFSVLFSNFKMYKNLYIVGIYLFTILSFTTYYYYSQNKIKDLKPFKDQYNNIVVKYNADVNYLKDSYDSQLKIERSGFDSYKKQCKTLQKLDRVTKKNPTKVEKLINKASQNRISCFEAATGNKDKVNDLCKDYYKE